jgi:hypothetical protein
LLAVLENCSLEQLFWEHWKEDGRQQFVAFPFNLLAYFGWSSLLAEGEVNAAADSPAIIFFALECQSFSDGLASGNYAERLLLITNECPDAQKSRSQKAASFIIFLPRTFLGKE